MLLRAGTLAGGLAIVSLVTPQVRALSPPQRQPQEIVEQHLCELVAKPGDAFTAIRARRAVSRDAVPTAIAPATIDVTYVGFESAPDARAAMEYAIGIWRATIASPMPIRIRAEFAPLGANVLGRANARFVWRQFAAAPIADTWYPDALADRLGAYDLSSGDVDIVATFNSTFPQWYFGTDAATHAGQYDFVTVAVHELAHGLGFAGAATVHANGDGQISLNGFPTVYDRMTATESGAALLSLANPSAQLGIQLRRPYAGSPTGPGVYWAGSNGVAANGSVMPRLYTPSSWSDASSYSHLDENVFVEGNPNSLMTHALAAAEAIHDQGPVALAMLRDMGWQTASTSAGTMGVSPALLRFSGTNNNGTLGPMTGPQQVTVNIAGASSATWHVSTAAPWIHIEQGSGSGSGAFTVSIVNPNNAIGTSPHLEAMLTVIGTDIENSPASVRVELTLTSPQGGYAPPIGQVDTPAQNATGIVGAIGVTGWAVDDVGVASIKVYRTCLPFDAAGSCVVIGGANLVYLADAARLAGARPDVEAAYPSMPEASLAGWGVQILTNMLPHLPSGQLYGGQGTIELHVYAYDHDGHVKRLGRTTSDEIPTAIAMDNDHIAKPFGTLDTPALGETISGVIAIFGWALTPDSGSGALIPLNGSTLRVHLDGVQIGTVAYNQCRGTVGNPVPAGVYCNDDVANAFGNTSPQAPLTQRVSNPSRYRNLDAARGAIGAFTLDTRQLGNGTHTIAWSVTDSLGRVEGIGSRFFTVLNGGSLTEPPAFRQGDRTPDLAPSPRLWRPAEASGEGGKVGGSVSAQLADLLDAPAQPRGLASSLDNLRRSRRPVSARTGFDPATPMQEIAQRSDGVRHIAMPAGGRVEIALASAVDAGYLVANGQLRDLPIGSALNRATGVFTWTPPVGFLGTYRIAFMVGGQRVDVDVTVR